MEWVIGAMYGSGLFGALGLPVYLVLATVGYWYYNVINLYGFIYYVEVQWFETPVTGTLDEDLKVYTLANYLDYPARKLWIYEMLATLGAFNAVFPFTTFITMPALGLAAYYNELY